MLLSNSSIWARKSYLSVKAAAQEIYTAEQLAHTSKAKQLQVAPKHPFFLISSPASPDLTDCCGASLLCSFGALAQPLGDIAGRQESTSSGHVWASPMWACLASVEYQKYWKALKTFVHFIHIQESIGLINSALEHFLVCCGFENSLWFVTTFWSVSSLTGVAGYTHVISARSEFSTQGNFIALWCSLTHEEVTVTLTNFCIFMLLIKVQNNINWVSSKSS